MKINQKWLDARKAKGEVVGGGWFVFRRSKKTGRIGGGGQLPFEHGSWESAFTEAKRLAAAQPGETFQVLESHGAAGPFRAPSVENVEREVMK